MVKWRARRPHRRGVRTISDHLALMEEDKGWLSDLKWNAREEMSAMGRLKPEVQEAVKQTGYPAVEALRIERQMGGLEAVKTIWAGYSAEMTRAYGRR